MPIGRIVRGPNSWQDLAGPNRGYAEELYERFLKNPEIVDAVTRAWFETHGAPPRNETSTGNLTNDSTLMNRADIKRIQAAQRWVRNLREYGHLVARVNPIEGERPHHVLLDPVTYQLRESDLADIPAYWVWEEAPAGVETALGATQYLRQIYTDTLAFDFSHVHDGEERLWLTQTAETKMLLAPRPVEEQRATLIRLVEVEEFEKFLHRTFVGQKRFSIEGVDMLVPILDELIRSAAASGAKSVMMGMAHRGRLNILAHILGKTYEEIFSEFHASPNKELVPSEGSVGINHGWSGDVKYHLGASREMKEADIREVKLVLANNPSHLEFVNPVVEGYARADQENRNQPGAPAQDMDASLAILIHGDAAFPGEGVVAETLNLSRLSGYRTGGTIHIIANNQLGFTAEAEEGRSTRYASDLAKGFEIPIVHVNADDPDACVAAARLAHTYRQRYHKDFLIDLIGYRRWGHNEMDDPVMTQPRMYETIAAHPTVRVQYAEKLVTERIVSPEELQHAEEMIREQLQSSYEKVKAGGMHKKLPTLEVGNMVECAPTGVSLEVLEEMNDALLSHPPGFEVYVKLHRILERRRSPSKGEGAVDWGHAEALALASILADGTPVRMTGQDSERGTFSQRHLVLHDVKRGEWDCPLQRLPQARASFAIHNSPLSEASVMGFEYGYNVLAPETLVIWEAQFGDFGNAGQVLIDQFLASGRAKWVQPSGMMLLLPHGYEGQGPEHSSARLERYLQLSAEGNWRVVNPSTAAQYFHLLRLQAVQLRTDPHPLIVMTPKSLLRNPRAASAIHELVEGMFQPVLHKSTGSTGAVERLVLSSGKVAVDLDSAMEERGVPPWLAVARVEQLYPFPEVAILGVLRQYPNLRQVLWLQEEPQNMGAWNYMEPRLAKVLPDRVELQYIGRPERSSPAEGFADVHESSQRHLLEDTLTYDQ